jgi:hypothetical protein
LIEDRTYRSAVEIAEAEGITRSFVNRLLRLTLLAPDIVEAILDGRQPKGMQLEELISAMPSGWEAQREALLSGAASAWRWGAWPHFADVPAPPLRRPPVRYRRVIGEAQ